MSTYCEARFYRAVVETLNDRVGRYMLFMLVFSAGMWNSATGELPTRLFTDSHGSLTISPAFLPSSFAMYANLLAFSHAIRLPNKSDTRRTVLATFFFATGAIVGWPFSLLVSVPFVLEELFVFGSDRVQSTDRGVWQWNRVKRLVFSGLMAASLFVSVR